MTVTNAITVTTNLINVIIIPKLLPQAIHYTPTYTVAVASNSAVMVITLEFNIAKTLTIPNITGITIESIPASLSSLSPLSLFSPLRRNYNIHKYSICT